MDDSDQTRPIRSRSPSYPACDLKRAIRFMMRLHAAEEFRYTPSEAAIELWGYSVTSSTGFRVLAAVSHFGLIDEKGTAADRQIRISALGRRLVLGPDEDPEDYQEALQEAALCPEVYRRLWNHWSGDLPPRPVIKRFLVDELSFNKKVVDSFVSDFESTLRFAGFIDGLPDASTYSAMKGRGHGSNGTALHQAPVAAEAPARSFDLSISLMSGKQAKLTVPLPLSEADFDLLATMIPANLEMLKPTLVATPRAAPGVRADRLGTGRRHSSLS